MKGLLLLGGLSLIHAVKGAEKLNGKIDIADIINEVKEDINEVKDVYGCVTSAGDKWCPTLSKCLSMDEECVGNEKNLVGDDEDENGCIGSAGYKWCENLKGCFKPRELKSDWDVTCDDEEDEDENVESAVENESNKDSDLSSDAISEEISSEDQPSLDNDEASEDISVDDPQEGTVSDDSISADVSSVGETSIESQEDSVEDEKQVSASEDLSIDDSQDGSPFVEDESQVSASDDISIEDSQEGSTVNDDSISSVEPSLEDEILVSVSEDLSVEDSLVVSDDPTSDEVSSDQESSEEEEESSTDMEIDSMEISDDSLEGASDGDSLESDSIDDSSIGFSLEDKIREFMSISEDTLDEKNEETSSSVDLSMDKVDSWSDFNRWLKENDAVDEEESSSDEDSLDLDSSSVDSLEDKIRGFMSENEDIWDKYYEEDTSSGEFSMDNMGWWSDFDRWLKEKDYVDEEESSSDEESSIEEWDSSSVDSMEDKIREFMSENEDIWDKYYDEDTTSDEFSMDNMDWWSDFNRWLIEREAVDEVDPSDESRDEKESYSEEVLEDMIREFMSENEDRWDERNETGSDSDEVSMEEKDWWSEFNSWLEKKENVSSSFIESDFMDESSDPAWHFSSDGSQSSSAEEKSSSNDDSSSLVFSSEFGANFEENGSSSDKPLEKGKGWFKGGIYAPVIITLIVFLAIIACLIIMGTKRKRDRGRRSMRTQMLSSGGIDSTPAIKYLYKESKARKAEETADGPEYKAFTNLV